jgi:hypothetical protein
MAKLKRCRLFPSDPSEHDVLTLRKLIREKSDENELKVIKYLETGHMIFVCPGISRDILDESFRIICAPHVLTDGVWAWTADVVHYVNKYHLEVPGEFILHMKSNQWTVPFIEEGIRYEL